MNEFDPRNKYHRTIHDCRPSETCTATVDVYSVLEAFDVECPARQHALKKLLCAGLRGKGDAIQDLLEAQVSIERAIEMEKNRAGTGARR